MFQADCLDESSKNKGGDVKKKGNKVYYENNARPTLIADSSFISPKVESTLQSSSDSFPQGFGSLTMSSSIHHHHHHSVVEGRQHSKVDNISQYHEHSPTKMSVQGATPGRSDVSIQQSVLPLHAVYTKFSFDISKISCRVEVIKL